MFVSLGPPLGVRAIFNRLNPPPQDGTGSWPENVRYGRGAAGVVRAGRGADGGAGPADAATVEQALNSTVGQQSQVLGAAGAKRARERGGRTAGLARKVATGHSSCGGNARPRARAMNSRHRNPARCSRSFPPQRRQRCRRRSSCRRRRTSRRCQSSGSTWPVLSRFLRWVSLPGTSSTTYPAQSQRTVLVVQCVALRRRVLHPGPWAL